ncbi:hypothetical protein BH09ACT12_BH09ACT12_35510 [soil metagenome]
MRKLYTRAGQWLVEADRAGHTRDLVLGAAVLLVAAQLGLRAWALFPSWFYLDDYNLLLDAQSQSSVGHLLDPYNSHLMPAGRLVAWLVESSGVLDWSVAATSVLALQATAGAAAVWMLCTLFGVRWSVLAPLALYLFSPITVPAMMWWTAALNQVFLQTAFFLTVGAAIHYLRSRRIIWLLATLAAIGLGLLFYVKALLLGPVVAFLALAYFARGGPITRVRRVVRTYWPAAVGGAVLVGGYLVYYVSHVSEPFTRTGPGLVGRLADSMIGTAFGTALLGGPWRWQSTAPPNSFADPPSWTVHVAWVFVVLVILYGAFTRVRTLRAWALLAGYLIALLALLVDSRAPVYGSIIGLEYRYLTDAACALALVVGLVFLPLRGAVESSAPRAEPLLRVRVRPLVTAGLVLAICVSSIVSTVPYVQRWHHDNASDGYLHTLRRELQSHGTVDLADQTVPEEVVSGVFAPANQLRRLLPLLDATVAFPTSTDALVAVADDGTLRHAVIDSSVPAKPGSRPGCGWLVQDIGRTIPLEGRAFDWTWWIRIGYLSSADSPVVISAGDTVEETEVQRGAHSLYVKIEGGFDDVKISGLDDDVVMCVDSIDVGQPTAEGGLPL